MRELLKVEGVEGLSKDAQSGGVINTDAAGLKAARAAKQKILEGHSKIESLENRIERLESLLNKLVGE